MADFCYDCYGREFGNPENNDLAGLVKEGQLYFDLCEGCGWGWFDYEGKKVAEPAED